MASLGDELLAEDDATTEAALAAPRRRSLGDELLAEDDATTEAALATAQARQEDQEAKTRAVIGSVHGLEEAAASRGFAQADRPSRQAEAEQQMIDAENLIAKNVAILRGDVSKPPPEIPGGTSRSASIGQAIDLVANYLSRVPGSVVAQRTSPINFGSPVTPPQIATYRKAFQEGADPYSTFLKNLPPLDPGVDYLKTLKEGADLSKPTLPEALAQHVEKFGENIPAGPKQQAILDLAAMGWQGLGRSASLVGSPFLAGLRQAIDQGRPLNVLDADQMAPVYEAAGQAWEEYKKPLDPGLPATKTLPGPLGTRVTPGMAALGGFGFDVMNPVTPAIMGGAMKIAGKIAAPAARVAGKALSAEPLRPFVDPIKKYVGGAEAELGLAIRRAKETGFDPGITKEQAAFEHAAIGPTIVKDIKENYAPIVLAMKKIPPAGHEFVYKWAQAETPQARAVVEATLRQTGAGREAIEALEKARAVLGDEIIKNNLKAVIENYFPLAVREKMLPEKIRLGSAKIVPGETGAHKERMLMKELEKSITPKNLRAMDEELAKRAKVLKKQVAFQKQPDVRRLQKAAEQETGGKILTERPIVARMGPLTKEGLGGPRVLLPLRRSEFVPEAGLAKKAFVSEDRLPTADPFHPSSRGISVKEVDRALKAEYAKANRSTEQLIAELERSAIVPETRTLVPGQTLNPAIAAKILEDLKFDIPGPPPKIKIPGVTETGLPLDLKAGTPVPPVVRHPTPSSAWLPGQVETTLKPAPHPPGFAEGIRPQGPIGQPASISPTPVPFSVPGKVRAGASALGERFDPIALRSRLDLPGEKAEALRRGQWVPSEGAEAALKAKMLQSPAERHYEKILRAEEKAKKAGEIRPLPIETPQRANIVLQEELAKKTNAFVEDLAQKYKNLGEPGAQFYETDPAKILAQHGIASAVEGAHRGFLRDVGKKFVVQAKYAPEGYVDVADLGRTRKIISDELGSGFIPKDLAELLTKSFEPTSKLMQALSLPGEAWKITATLMQPTYHLNNYLTSLAIGLEKHGLLGWKRAHDALDQVRRGGSEIVSGTNRTAAEIKRMAERAGTLETGGPPAFAARDLREAVGLQEAPRFGMKHVRNLVNELGESATKADESNRVAYIVAELRKNGGDLEAATREAFRNITSTANKTPLERHLSVPFPFITWPLRAAVPTAKRVLEGRARLAPSLQNLSRALVPQEEQMHESFMPASLSETFPIQLGRRDSLGIPQVMRQRFSAGGTLGPIAEPPFKAAQALIGKGSFREAAESARDRYGAMLWPLIRGGLEGLTRREFITQRPLDVTPSASPIFKMIYEIAPEFAQDHLQMIKRGNRYYTDAGMLNSIFRSGIPVQSFVDLGVNLISRSADPETTRMSLLRAMGLPITASNPRFEAAAEAARQSQARSDVEKRQKRLKLRPQ